MNIILFESLDKKNALSINDERAFHILNVLHLETGDSFKCGVFNGSKGEGLITSIENDRINFTYTIQEEKPQNILNLAVILGAVRPICLRRILRAAGECGVKKIILTPTSLSEKSYMNSGFIKGGEAEKIIKDAAMQSGETSLLEFSSVDNLNEAFEMVSDAHSQNRIILDNKTEFYKTKPGLYENGVPCLQQQRLKKGEPYVLSIGSERGWTDEERSAFVKNGFHPYTISPRILRTETAFITSIFPFLSLC